jgi:hypothetical protein
VPPEPAAKRTVAFIDGQNLFHSAREAFGYTYPNYDVRALVERVCAGRDWQLAHTRFYTGIPRSRGRHALARLLVGQARGDGAAGRSCLLAVSPVPQQDGAAALYATCPLERAFRDVHAMTQHIVVHPRILETTGQGILWYSLDWNRRLRLDGALIARLHRQSPHMRKYLRSRLVQVGLVLLILGSGPLVAVIGFARLGFYHDPDPNPVFLGMLAGLTLWPAVILIGIGIWRVRRRAGAV